ncbi:MAG: amidohydrolase family protein [Eubacteriales bacterium]|nr:amidohydrolase family protein [Eubacteriales bacterium]
MISCDILIKEASCLTEDFSVADDQAIAIKDGRILAVCPQSEADKLYQCDHIVAEKGRLWMPGLIDGHMHTGQQLLKGRILDELPMIWTRIMLPFESTLTPEKMTLSAQLAALEMIKSGTTGFVDAGSYFMENAASVYEACGIRGALSCSSMDQGNFPPSIRQNAKEALHSADCLYDSFHGKGNLKVFYSLRALMNCSRELTEGMAFRAKERETCLQAHMNEYPGEVNYTLEKFQMHPVEYLDSLDVLGDNFVAAHGIMLSPGERELLARNKAKVVHCPFSNCGKGVPDTPSLMERGICVGLGTDGAAHGGLSLWNEMKIFRSVMNAVWGVRNADPAVMPARKILAMATAGGAEILGEKGQLGVLKKGYRADMISIDWNKPHLFPTLNRMNTLLECVTAEDVADSMVNGKFLMRNREVLTLDEEKILYQAKKYFENQEVPL